MKIFLQKIFIFLLIIVIADKSVGAIIGFLSSHSNDSDSKQHNYVTQRTNEDILIFGSSRALHHYNPSIIRDSLNMSCYNCGQDGNGIIFFYGIWQQIQVRYRPRMIIYDVFPLYDIYKGEDNHRYLGLLKGDYHREGVQEVFDAVDRIERYKMLSSLYRWNSDFLQVAIGLFKKGSSYKDDGFVPLHGALNPLKIKKKTSKEKDVLDPLKMQFLEQLIKKAKGINLVFVVSPSWYGIPKEKLDPIRSLCIQEHIPFVDFSHNNKYVNNDVYFRDGSHLNNIGADEFTKDLIFSLKLL